MTDPDNWRNPVSSLSVPTEAVLKYGDNYVDHIIDPTWLTHVNVIRSYLDESYSIDFPKSKLPITVSTGSHKLAWGRTATEKFTDRIIPVLRDAGTVTMKMKTIIHQAVSDAVRFGNSTIIVTDDGGVRVSNPTTSFATISPFGTIHYQEDLGDDISLHSLDGEECFLTTAELEGSSPVDAMQTFTIFYRADAIHPLGQSRISPALQGIIKSASRNLVREEIASEWHSSPQRYVNGLWADLDPSVPGAMNKMEAGGGTVIGFPRHPVDDSFLQLGEFSQSDFTPFTKLHEQFARDAAAASNLSPDEFGVPGTALASADALAASKEDLVIECTRFSESIQDTIQAFLVEVAWINGEPTPRLSWANPSTPSRASQADAFVKLAAAIPGMASSKAAMAWAGLPEEVIADLFADSVLNLPEE